MGVGFRVKAVILFQYIFIADGVSDFGGWGVEKSALFS